MRKGDIRIGEQYAHCDRGSLRWTDYGLDEHGPAEPVTVMSKQTRVYAGVRVRLEGGEEVTVQAFTLVSTWPEHLAYLERHRQATQARQQLQALIEQVRPLLGNDRSGMHVLRGGPCNEPQHVSLHPQQFAQLADLALRGLREQPGHRGLQALLGDSPSRG